MLAFFLKADHPSDPLPSVKKDTMTITKTKYFVKNRDHFNCVFIGDSRTFQAIDPQVIDHFLGTSSYNLGGAANWFETQYAQLSDILPTLSQDTIVVWSIGHNNFASPYNYVTASYPLRWSQLLLYWRYGFSWNELKGNFFTYHLIGPYARWIPGLSVYKARTDYYEALKEKIDLPVVSPHADFPKHKTEVRQMPNFFKFSIVYREMMENKGVSKVSTVTGGDKITGALIYKNRGVLLLMELDPEYFLQKKMEEERLPVLEETFRPDPRYLKLFDAILDLFQKYKIRVVVNEFEYAPYAYGNSENYEKYNVFMKSIAERVEKRNIPYVRVFRMLFNDDDYYDVNHLNYSGAEKYSAWLAKALKTKGFHAV